MRSGESGDQQPAGKGRQPVVSVSQSSRCLAPSTTGARVSEAAESNKSWPDNNFTSKRSIKLSNEVSLGHCHGQRVAWLPLLDQHTRSLQEDGAQGRLGRGICYFVVITTLFLLDTKDRPGQGNGRRRRRMRMWGGRNCTGTCSTAAAAVTYSPFVSERSSRAITVQRYVTQLLPLCSTEHGPVSSSSFPGVARQIVGSDRGWAEQGMMGNKGNRGWMSCGSCK